MIPPLENSREVPIVNCTFTDDFERRSKGMKLGAKLASLSSSLFAPRCRHCVRILAHQEQIASGYCDADCHRLSTLDQSELALIVPANVPAGGIK